MPRGQYIFDLSQITQLPFFSPPYHTKTKDRIIIDESIGARHLALWHGTIEPGGEADTHFHSNTEQVFIILRGRGLFEIADKKYEVTKNGLVFIPLGHKHRVSSIGKEPLELLIIMAPPPASLEGWHLETSP